MIVYKIWFKECGCYIFYSDIIELFILTAPSHLTIPNINGYHKIFLDINQFDYVYSNSQKLYFV